MPSIDGLDIHGAYQPVTSWQQIPDYALMSVKATEGGSFIQPNAAAYWSQFRARPFKYRGLYIWLRPDATAKAHFDNIKRFVVSQGGLHQGEFLQTDWERTGSLPMPTLAQVLEFNDRCQQEWPGRLIVYVSDWVTNFHQWLATQPVEPLWYANYNIDKDNYNGGWQECARYGADIWQVTSTLHVPGIGNGNVSCDGNHVFNWKALDRIAGYRVLDPPAPIEVDPPVVVTPPVAPAGSVTEQELQIMAGSWTVVGVKESQDGKRFLWNGFVKIDVSADDAADFIQGGLTVDGAGHDLSNPYWMPLAQLNKYRTVATGSLG